MPCKKYRVAVVGAAGTWGRKYLKAYANHPDCEIVGVADRAKDRRQDFADLYGIKLVVDDIHEILEREVPDIVSAIVPVAHNGDIATACADAGVRVVSVEKPFAANLADADRVVDYCREKGTLLACGQTGFGIPYQREVTQWVREGNIGALTAAYIPRGIPLELSGAGCVELSMMRLLTGMEVEWVEGGTHCPQSPRTYLRRAAPQSRATARPTGGSASQAASSARYP